MSTITGLLGRWPRRTVKWIGFVAAVGAALTLLVGVSIVAGAPASWFGDLPTWLACATVGFAALRFWSELGDRRMAHAAQLSCWVESDTSRTPWKSWLVIANHSDMAFHDVTVQVRLNDRLQPLSRLQILTPGKYTIERLTNEEFNWDFPQPYSAVAERHPMNSRKILGRLGLVPGLARTILEEHRRAPPGRGIAERPSPERGSRLMVGTSPPVREIAPARGHRSN